MTTRTLWTAQLAGHANQTFFAGGRHGLAYVGDGDGVLYANLRFRAFSLADGHEVASVRTGTTVRCVTTFPDGDLLAATDHRLHRLDPLTLAERRRWDRGVPDYGDSIALCDSVCALASWRGPTVALVNLDDGAVRRRRWVDLPRLVETPTWPLLIASSDGEVSTVDLARGDRTVAYRTAETRDALVHEGMLWIVKGRPKHGVKDEGESRDLLAYDLTTGVRTHELHMPSSANRLAAAGDAVWAFGRDWIVEIHWRGQPAVVGRWPVPTGHRWSAVDPVRRLALSSTTSFTAPSTMTCHVLEG